MRNKKPLIYVESEIPAEEIFNDIIEGDIDFQKLIDTLESRLEMVLMSRGNNTPVNGFVTMLREGDSCRVIVHAYKIDIAQRKSPITGRDVKLPDIAQKIPKRVLSSKDLENAKQNKEKTGHISKD